MTPALLAGVLLFVIPGCFVRTIYVPHGTPVRLREDVPDAKVWIKDKDGKRVAGKVTLKEGWYALPLSVEEKAPSTDGSE